MRNVGRLLAVAGLDLLEAWRDLRAGGTALVSTVWGPFPTSATVGLALASAGASAWVRGPVDASAVLTFPALLFSGLAAARIRTAATGEHEPREVRAMLVALGPALVALVGADQVLAAIEPVSLGAVAPATWLLEHAGDAAAQLAFTAVLVAALIVTSKWFGAVIELVLAYVGLLITLWLGRIFVEFFSAIVSGLLATALSAVGLGAVARVLAGLDELGDLAWSLGVAGGVLAACWLVATELVPRALAGQPVRLVEAVGHVLRRGLR